MTAYYSQWETEDLLSWQGKVNLRKTNNYDEDHTEIRDIEQEIHIQSLEDYGMSWRDFV